MGYEIDFLAAYKHGHFFPIDSITLGVHSQVYTISLQYLKEKAQDEVDFCLRIIAKDFFKVILS